MFNSQSDRSSLLNIVIRLKETNYFTRIYGTDVCLLTFVADKIFDCKRNLSIFCSVAVFSGFSVENESILTLL